MTWFDGIVVVSGWGLAAFFAIRAWRLAYKVRVLLELLGPIAAEEVLRQCELEKAQMPEGRD